MKKLGQTGVLYYGMTDLELLKQGWSQDPMPIRRSARISGSPVSLEIQAIAVCTFEVEKALKELFSSHLTVKNNDNKEWFRASLEMKRWIAYVHYRHKLLEYENRLDPWLRALVSRSSGGVKNIALSYAMSVNTVLDILGINTGYPTERCPEEPVITNKILKVSSILRSIQPNINL